MASPTLVVPKISQLRGCRNSVQPTIFFANSDKVWVDYLVIVTGTIKGSFLFRTKLRRPAFLPEESHNERLVPRDSRLTKLKNLLCGVSFMAVQSKDLMAISASGMTDSHILALSRR